MRNDQSVWLIFTIALVARLSAALILNMYLDRLPDRQYLIEGDADGYWILAQKLAAGEDFSLYTPERHVMRMPGYPALLSISITLFGESLHACRYFLAVVTSFAVFPVYWLGQRIRGPALGALSALFIAILPVYVGFSVALLSETIFAGIITTYVWAMDGWIHRAKSFSESLKWSSLSGLIAAAGMYVRPSLLLLPIALIPLILLRTNGILKQRILATCLMLACLLGPLIPWGIRNQQLTGHFVLTTLWMGPSLYDGLNSQATGDSDMTFFEQEKTLARMSEYEMNQHYKDRAVEFARQNPLRSIELGLYKLIRYWSLWPNAKQFQNPFLVIVTGLSNTFLLIGAVWGIWLLRTERTFLFLCLLPIVYFAAIHTVFVSSLRYRLPAEYPVMVIVAFGWYQLTERFTRG